MFPKIIHGHTHAEYISLRSHSSLLLNQCTQVIDLCGWVTPVSQPVNSKASVMETLVTCANIMSYRTDILYLVFYITSFQKWESTNNFLNHYRQQAPANANLHYHSGICVIYLEPLSRGQHPLTIYYEPHAFLQTPRVRTMVAGAVFWDHMPLILNFPINMDLTVAHNVQGSTINFAKVTHQSFGPLHNLLYYLTQGQFYYNLGGIWYPACQSFP